MNVQPMLCGGNGKATDLQFVLPESSGSVSVLGATALLEGLPCSPEALRYKILAGSRMSAGSRLTELWAVFEDDPRAMKRWATELLSDDVASVVRTFEGRRVHAKVSESLSWGISPGILDLFAQHLPLHLIERDYGRLADDEAQRARPQATSPSHSSTGTKSPSPSHVPKPLIDGADTHDAVVEFRNRLPGKREVVIHGDAAGRARDTHSKATNSQILTDEGFPRQAVPRANPLVRERHNQMNAMLKAADGTVSILIHPRCKTLLSGLETVRIKPGAQ